MLIDVTKRRERLKKQLIVLEQQEWPLLLQQDPAAALALLQEWHQQRRQTAQQDQGDTTAAAAGEQPQQPQQQGALPVAAGAAVAPPPPQQLEHFTLPLPQQQLLPASAMLGLPMGGPAGSLQMLPQQQQLLRMRWQNWLECEHAECSRPRPHFAATHRQPRPKVLQQGVRLQRRSPPTLKPP